jgi:hypothetical protein
MLLPVATVIRAGKQTEPARSNMNSGTPATAQEETNLTAAGFRTPIARAAVTEHGHVRSYAPGES